MWGIVTAALRVRLVVTWTFLDQLETSYHVIWPTTLIGSATAHFRNAFIWSCDWNCNDCRKKVDGEGFGRMTTWNTYKNVGG